MNPLTRIIVLIVVLAGIIGAIAYLEAGKVHPTALVPQTQELSVTSTPATTTPETVKKTEPIVSHTPDIIAAKEKKYKKFTEIANPSGFLNTGGKPITIGELVGKKVIMVDFWTYSCINCQRTLPYLTAWYAKYKDEGFEIVSIHTPEFEFEKDPGNVADAAKRFSVTYPIVQDNDYGTWRAYNNFYWPHHYLIDIDGYVVEDHIGEGGYAETESKIQELLAERAKRLGEDMPKTAPIGTPKGAETVDTSHPLSPEMYFGAFRNEYLGNGIQGETGSQTLTVPGNLTADRIYLDGGWNFSREYTTNTTANAAIKLHYHAQKVFIVAHAEKPVKAKILIDGSPIPAAMRGADISADGTVTFSENRLYRLVEDRSWGEHTIEIIIESPGLDAYTFTFG